MASLLDLMPKDEREKAIARGKKRMERKKGSTISPELYITAEFGYYFGWEGVLAIKRGYIEKVGSNSEIIKEPFTLDEVLALIEAAKKVWYTKVIDQSHGNLVATNAAHSNTPGQTFNRGISTFSDRVELG